MDLEAVQISLTDLKLIVYNITYIKYYFLLFNQINAPSCIMN